jgi:drug/metabolite transporter (DMT)-like permease
MIFIILAMITYAVIILLITSASRNIDSKIVTTISNVFSIFIPLAVAIPVISRKNFHNQKYGIALAVLAGVLIGIYSLLVNKSYAVNKVGIVAPLVFGGAILISTVASYFIFKEKISLGEGIGLGFLLIGFAVLFYARATT